MAGEVDWYDKQEVHGAFGELAELLGTLAGSEVEEPTDDDEAITRIAGRAVSTVDAVKGYLAAADPHLVANETLSGLFGAANGLRTQVDQLLQGETYVAPSEFENSVEAIVVVLPRLAAIVAPSAEDVAAASRRMTSSVDRAARKAAHALEALRESVTDLSEERDNLQATFAEEFDGRANELRTQLDALDVRAETAESERQSAFDELIAAQGEEFKETKQTVVDSLTKLLDDANAKYRKLEKLYGVISDRATSGAFAKEAKEQADVANTWRKHAIKLGAGSVAVAAVVATTAILVHGTWQQHIGGFLLAILLTGLAAYAGKQSGRHRQREERAKRLELELLAFGPFVDAVDDEKRIRSEYAQRLFRGSEDIAELPRATDDHLTVAQTVGEAVLEALRRLAPGK